MEIAEVIGMDNAKKLCQTFGGTRLWVPRTFRSGHRILDLLDPNGITLLCFHYGSSALFVPKDRHSFIERRNGQIFADRQNNLTINQIALKHSLSERWVYELFARATAEASLDLDEDRQAPAAA
jgi:Mor transcription activator family